MHRFFVFVALKYCVAAAVQKKSLENVMKKDLSLFTIKIRIKPLTLSRFGHDRHITNFVGGDIETMLQEALSPVALSYHTISILLA